MLQQNLKHAAHVSTDNFKNDFVCPKMKRGRYLRKRWRPLRGVENRNLLSHPDDLTHWGRVTHICVGKSTIIGSDNGLSPDRRQAIIWTNAGILLIGPLGTYFSEILTGIQTFSFKKMHLKMSSAKWRPFCLGLNVLRMEAYVIRMT